jgi:hypothetical protein
MFEVVRECEVSDDGDQDAKAPFDDEKPTPAFLPSYAIHLQYRVCKQSAERSGKRGGDEKV